MNARTRACLCIILAAALWGVIGVFFNLLSGLGFTQMQVVAIRSATAAAALGLYLLVRDRPLFRVRLRDCWCFVGTGVFSLVFFNWCYFTAMELTSLAVAAVLLYTAPMFVMLFSALLFREPIGPRKVVALAMTFAGCLLVAGGFGSGGAVSPRGFFVGLGAGKAGNSEAGHSNLGAGRCVMQDDVRLDAAVKDGSFKKNPIFLEAIEHAKRNGTALHLLAYLTYKSSHGCIDYPLNICEMAKEAGLEKVYFHIIFDGRSTEPGSAPTLLAELDAKLDAIGLGRIVDGVGRGVALDRDKNYDKVKRAYDAMVDGVGTQYE